MEPDEKPGEPKLTPDGMGAALAVVGGVLVIGLGVLNLAVGARDLAGSVFAFVGGGFLTLIGLGGRKRKPEAVVEIAESEPKQPRTTWRAVLANLAVLMLIPGLGYGLQGNGTAIALLLAVCLVGVPAGVLVLARRDRERP